MLRQLALALPVVVLLAGALAPRAEAQSAPLAERAPEVVLMLERLGVYDVLGIMAAEGEAAALTLEDEMFPGEGGAAWIAEASRLQSADRMTDLFEEFFPVAQMSAEQVAQVTRFFESEPGLSISEAEVAGRRAFLDPSAEEAANAAFRQAVSAGDPRVDLLTGFIEANDLVERNVQGALNSNFAFYRGLADGEAFAVEMPEELMLSEVWGQEPQLRRDTIEWLYSFQLSAYSGLADGDIEAYTAFSETEAGRALNRALFTAFDAVFEQLSYELGFAAARFIAGEDA